MAEASWPFYGVETNETQFAKWASTLVESGIDSGLAVTAGTGLQVLVAAGSAIVRGVYYENTASVGLAIGAAPAAGLTRRDAVVLRLDQTANVITLAVKAGTATSGGGTLPSLTQNDTTWEVLIATVSITSGVATVTSGMIDEKKPSTGLRVLTYDASDRPTPTDAVAIGLDLTAKKLEAWIGGVWVNMVDLATIAGTLSVAKGGTGATSASAARTNLGAAAADHVHGWADITGKPSTFAPSGHNHSAADITSGALPLTRGGSGATTAKGLREAAEIFVQPSAPSHKAGRVWIQGTALS